MAKKHFSSQDIGSELLPIITRGIYRDPLDTLREYVQNGIDANAHHIEIAVSSDLVSVRDDGHGMTLEVAHQAMRLGMSEKDPRHDVGFRGIGIYSGFNVCEKLEIYTCPSSGATSKLVFDFARIRARLASEEANRMGGGKSKLSLEKLLSDAVWREDCDSCPFTGSGTQVLLIGIRGEVYQRLTNWTIVRRYLEDVVPLAFSNSFRFKHAIESHFRKLDYRVVDLELKINERTEHLQRPYHDGIFTHGRGIGPQFYTLGNVLAGGKIGFAWVCLNDARKYLPDRILRGLLIKKFGFSVGGRELLARFFSRIVFNNRITGEVIVTHKALLPNAARTEFEPNAVRDGLDIELSELASKISSWANIVQEELKAREELETIAPNVFDLAQKIPSSERDIAMLLRWNNVLESYDSRLRTHRKTLKKLDPELLNKTTRALEDARKTIAEILSIKHTPARGHRKRIEQVERLRAMAPDTATLVHGRDRPSSLLEAVRAAELETSEGLGILLDYLDREVLRPKMSDSEYVQFIEDLVAYLDEAL